MTEERCHAKDCQRFVTDPGDAICASCCAEMQRLVDARGLVFKGPQFRDVSDGYHTFSELYEHRFELWIALCRYVDAIQRMARQTGAIVAADEPAPWRSQVHSDGSGIDGWFLLGIGSAPGQQLTYHLPMARWADCSFAQTFDRAPKFDGHTSADVLARLRDV